MVQPKRVRLPACSIFVVSALLCIAIAAASGAALFVFMFQIVESSVLSEGDRLADAVSARLNSTFANMQTAREEFIYRMRAIESIEDIGSRIGDNHSAMSVFLNETFSTSFIAQAVSSRFQGAEIAVLFPRNISENYEATGFSRLQIYYEKMKNGDRIFSRSLTDQHDGIGHTTAVIDFESDRVDAAAGSPRPKVYQYPVRGATRFVDDTNYSFVNSYQSDASTSDYSYFAGYAGPDGYAYFYASSYRYFFTSDIDRTGTKGYLAEVTVYQLVDDWYGLIESSLGSSTDAHIVIIDPTTKLVVATSFNSLRSRTLSCFQNFSEYEDQGGDCFKVKFYESTERVIRGSVGSMWHDQWASVGVAVPSRSVKAPIDDRDYYIVSKQLANVDSFRPFLVWSRAADTVSRELKNLTVIIVVASSVGIALAMVMVAVVTAFLLLRPMKQLQEQMRRLTNMEDDTMSFAADDETDDDERLAAKAYEDARQQEDTDDDDVGVASECHSSTVASVHTPGGDEPSADKPTAKKATRVHSRIVEVSDLQKHFRQMAKALQSFSRYVPRDVVKELIATGSVANSGMREYKVTVIFTDIQGFTTMCEKLRDPKKIGRLLTHFFSMNSHCLQSHGATIDKFIGDCIMAFWGAPLRVDNPNFRALCAGLGLIKTTCEMRDVFKRHNVSLAIRVGCHCGRALVGNIGSVQRINYTAMGDVVNAASRLEGANKEFASRFLVSDEVLQMSRRSTMFTTRYVGRIVLRGKSKKITAYSVCGIQVAEGCGAMSPAGGKDETPRNAGLLSPLSASKQADPFTPQSTRNFAESGLDSTYQQSISMEGSQQVSSGQSPNTNIAEQLSTVRGAMLTLDGCFASISAFAYLRPPFERLAQLFSKAVTAMESNTYQFSSVPDTTNERLGSSFDEHCGNSGTPRTSRSIANSVSSLYNNAPQAAGTPLPSWRVIIGHLRRDSEAFEGEGQADSARLPSFGASETSIDNVDHNALSLLHMAPRPIAPEVLFFIEMKIALDACAAECKALPPIPPALVAELPVAELDEATEDALRKAITISSALPLHETQRLRWVFENASEMEILVANAVINDATKRCFSTLKSTVSKDDD